MEDKKISALGYGFAIVSPGIFEQCRKDRQIKDKKMLSYFSKDNNAFYGFISQGAFIPVHHVNYDRYFLCFSVGQLNDSLLNDWNIQVSWQNFNLQIDNSNSIWAIEFAEMDKWSINKLNKSGNCIEGVYYDIDDNEHIEYKAIKYCLPEGKYDVKIYGLSRKIKTHEEKENYGFLFELIKTESFTSKTDPSETNFRELFEK
jgi:hypothetical protein